MLLIETAAITSPFGRPLGAQEEGAIRRIFEQAVDTSRLRIATTFVVNAPTTFGNQIRIARGYNQDGDEWLSVLVHETAHVWQYQTRGTRYITDSVFHQVGAAIATGTRNAAYFNYQLAKGASIYDYAAEEQAQIIEDYYDLTVQYANASNPPSWVVQRRGDLELYEGLIQQVRRSSPLPEAQLYERSLMRLPDGPTVDPLRTPNYNIVPFLRIDF